MHRTQISLEPEQYERLAQEAHRLGISMSALIRRLIAEHFARQPPPEDPLGKLLGIAEGSGDYVGRNHNRYLYGENRELE